jgi:hypothetical protein
MRADAGEHRPLQRAQRQSGPEVQQFVFGTGATWQTPLSIPTAPFVKFRLQFDF